MSSNKTSLNSVDIFISDETVLIGFAENKMNFDRKTNNLTLYGRLPEDNEQEFFFYTFVVF